ncbi:MAG: hypothetical protein JNJ45_00835 [Chthonomonas sp.]|nr:hypothetical protein [Chthonomonas sp.]
MNKLRQMFRFSKPATPGFGISSGFYLMTFIPTTALPTPHQLANPEGADGAEVGLIVPLEHGAVKTSLTQPMHVGSYGIVSPDKKSMLHMAITNLGQSTGFDPRVAADTREAGHLLSPEVREVMRATWLIAQFKFKSHDAMVRPAIRQVYGLAARLAELTGGIVCDPLAQRYSMGPDARVSEDLYPSELLSFHERNGKLMTKGMSKFGLPEMSIAGYSEENRERARETLEWCCLKFFRSLPLSVGDRPKGHNHTFMVVQDADVPAGGYPTLELIPHSATSVDEVLEDFFSA